MRIARTNDFIISPHDNASFRRYLDESGRHALLTPEDEKQLAREISAGIEALDELERAPTPSRANKLHQIAKKGDAARARFIQSNLRLVLAMAKNYQTTPNYSVLDVIQDGNLGLMRAVDRFDPSRGFRFSTYATWWIRQGIHNGIANNGRTIRLPSEVLDRVRELNLLQEDILSTKGRPATIRELATETGWTETAVANVLARSVPVTSLFSLIGEGDESSGVSLEALIGDADVNVGDEAIELSPADVDPLLAPLTTQEQSVLRLRFGLDGDVRSLKAIGKMYGLSHERIRQIEAKATSKLRHPCMRLITRILKE